MANVKALIKTFFFIVFFVCFFLFLLLFFFCFVFLTKKKSIKLTKFSSQGLGRVMALRNANRAALKKKVYFQANLTGAKITKGYSLNIPVNCTFPNHDKKAVT